MLVVSSRRLLSALRTELHQHQEFLVIIATGQIVLVDISRTTTYSDVIIVCLGFTCQKDAHKRRGAVNGVFPGVELLSHTAVTRTERAHKPIGCPIIPTSGRFQFSDQDLMQFVSF